MKRFSALVFLTLIALSLPAYAGSVSDKSSGESFKAVPFSYNLEEVGGNLQDFIQTFAVVENESKDFRKFELERNPRLYSKSENDWFVTMNIIPQEVEVSFTTYFGSQMFVTYKVVLAYFVATFDYFGPQKEYSKNGFEQVVRAMVRVNFNLQESSLSDEQGAMLIDSIKKQKPINLKGRLLIFKSGSTLNELKDNLGRINFDPIEINGTPVKRYSGY